MGDLISRQAAIDAIETGKKNHGDFLTSSFVGYEMAEKIVKALPPALPDLDEWCTDCKEYDKERNSCPRWNRVIKETLEDLQEERKMQLSEKNTTSDCISRQAAIQWVKTECNPYGKPTLDYESGRKVIEHLEAMRSNAIHTARAEGKWIRESLVTNYPYKCSACKKYTRAMYDFCPNCGADMRGEEK